MTNDEREAIRQQYRDDFHYLLRELSMRLRPQDKHSLMLLVYKYYQEMPDKPLLCADTMTRDEKENIRGSFTIAIQALHKEVNLVGSKDIVKLLSGYTLFRIEVFPVCTLFVDINYKGFDTHTIMHWRSDLISAEWRLRYWAYGPSFFEGGKVVTHKQIPPDSTAGVAEVPLLRRSFDFLTTLLARSLQYGWLQQPQQHTDSESGSDVWWWKVSYATSYDYIALFDYVQPTVWSIDREYRLNFEE